MDNKRDKMINVLLEAPILTQSGYGEHSRLVFESIYDDNNINLFINPLNWGETGWIAEETSLYREIQDCISKFALFEEERKRNSSLKYDFQIHVGIPNEFEKKAPKSICVTAGIETDRVSFNWLLKTHPVNNGGIEKIIVPSNHSRDVFLKTKIEVYTEKDKKGEKGLLTCKCPVDVVPYPVKTVTPKSIDLDISTTFNFLSIGLLGYRKNIEQSLTWFIEEFKDNEDVGFILKTSVKNGSVIDNFETTKHLEKALNSHKDRKCKIYLLHGDMTEEEIHGLYLRDDVKAYVSLSHGEGFGLPIFEAAYSGLPIIATDWSGHIDFLTAPYKQKNKQKNKKLFSRVDFSLKKVPDHAIWKDIIVKDSRWAYPKEQSYKSKLRDVYKNYGMYKKWSTVLKNSVLEEYEKSKILKNMKESILSILEIAPPNSDSDIEDVVLL
jgi:glycosyltransferase involved in cell wall biosynthesis